MADTEKYPLTEGYRSLIEAEVWLLEPLRPQPVWRRIVGRLRRLVRR